jgi:hypothetical protein
MVMPFNASNCSFILFYIKPYATLRGLSSNGLEGYRSSISVLRSSGMFPTSYKDNKNIPKLFFIVQNGYKYLLRLG